LFCTVTLKLFLHKGTNQINIKKIIIGFNIASILNCRVNFPCYSIKTKVTPEDERVKRVNQSHYRPEVPRGFQEVKVPRLLDNGTGWW